MQSHVRQTVSRCFAVLRQLRTVRRQVPTSVFQSLIVALVLSRLDYCNSVLFGLPANLIQRLQSVQNAAARLIFRIRQSEQITPALINLHWLGVPERISFKLAVMTYRSTYGTSPSYLQSCFARVAHMTSRRRLRSSTSHRSSVYSRQAGVSGFWCHCLERPASPRRICFITRGFQTTNQNLSVFPFLYQDTVIIWLVCYYYHSSLLSGHLWSLQKLALYATLKCLRWWWWWWSVSFAQL